MTSVVSPYGMPVTTGKPGIRLALSSFGFSQSPFPALCRQSTTCAWRPRLRKIPDRRSAEVRVETGISGRPRQPKRPSAGTGPEFLGSLGGPEARRRSKRLNGTHRRRAPNVTHSVVSETRVRKTVQSLNILHIASERENWSPNQARQTLRTMWFCGHEGP